MTIRFRFARPSVLGSALGLLLVVLAPAASPAMPHFDIVIAQSHVGGRISGDGSTIGWSVADASAASGHYDVASRTRTTFAYGSEGVSTTVISRDGSLLRSVTSNGADALIEWNGGVVSDLGTPFARPFDLSDDGSTGVVYSRGSAYRSTGNAATGTFEPLGDLAGGGTMTIGWGISGDGSIIAGTGASTNGDEAFRWESGVMTGLGDLAGGVFDSAAFGVSRDGSTIVGFGTGTGGQEAVRWTAAGIESIQSADYLSSRATAVSGDGSVIVGDGVRVDGTDTTFIWDAVNGMRSLEVLLQATGLDLMRVDVRQVLGVSDDGLTFIGVGYQGDDAYIDPVTDQLVYLEGVGNHLWVASVPEPSTAVLLALGLSALARRRTPAG